MKVFHVLNHFLPQKTAGTEIYTWALSKRLQERDIDVQVIIPQYGQNFDFDYDYDGLKIHMYAEPSSVDRSLIMGFRHPYGLNNFLSFLHQHRPDIVHFHELAGSNGITLRHVQAAKEFGAKIIMTFHLAGYSCKTGTLVYQGKELCNGLIDFKKCGTCYVKAQGLRNAAPYLVGISNILYKLKINTLTWGNKLGTALGTIFLIDRLQSDLHSLILACDRVVAISEFYYNILLANGIDEQKICYVQQGLPLATVNEAMSKRIIQCPLRILFLGRINNLKGLHLLLETLSSINATLVELTIYGNSDDYQYESALRAKTSKLSNIHWKGKLSQSEVIPTMRKYDILFLGSTFSEMSPLVIQEAFAAGLPVLASNVHGNAEQVKHGINGLLFKFNDKADLKYQIEKLINDPSYIQKLSENIIKPKSFDIVAEQYLELYNDMLK